MITVPDQKVPILDLMPRLEIIEDQFFRKSIPKSTKFFKGRKSIADGEGLQTLSPTNFMKSVIQEQLQMAKDRDTKYVLMEKTRETLGVLDAKTSESTKQVKGTLNVHTKEKIFGVK